MKFISFVNKISLRREADELGISIWKTPSFLFILMGIFIAGIMELVYFLSRSYDSPEFLIISECFAFVIIFSIGNIIIKSVEQIAIANKIKSEFVTIASHQLKTPLSQMNWELELLLSKHKEGLNTKQLEIIQTINKSHEAMARLVNDLLDVARIEQRRFVLNKEKMNLPEIVESVIEDNRIIAKASNVEINFVKSEKIPEIIADKKRIAVVIDNLISNAIKYMESKGFVEIRVESDEKNITVSVKDNGVGIPEGQQDKVFQKFFRSNNVVRYQTEGTGLGLYISKNIIEQSGGRMWFESIEGSGSNFYFTLPIKDINR